MADWSPVRYFGDAITQIGKKGYSCTRETQGAQINVEFDNNFLTRKVHSTETIGA